MIASLVLPDALRAQIAREARRAFPHECCGLIEGAHDGARLVAVALHPTINVAPDDDRFEIDAAAHIALQKKLRGTAHAIIGCYHSHPNGRAEPSARDGGATTQEGFLWLIHADDLRGFVWTRAGFSEAALTTAAFA